MRIYCLSCWHRLGRLVAAVDLGDIWRCDACAEAVFSREVSQ